MIHFAEARDIAAMLTGLADPIRMKIVDLLINGPASVGVLAKALEIPMVNTSHHLKVMRQAGILDHEKDGRRVIYSLSTQVTTQSKSSKGLVTFTFKDWTVTIHKPE